MGEQHIGIAAAGDFEGLTTTHGQDFHIDVRLLGEQGQQPT